MMSPTLTSGVPHERGGVRQAAAAASESFTLMLEQEVLACSISTQIWEEVL